MAIRNKNGNSIGLGRGEKRNIIKGLVCRGYKKRDVHFADRKPNREERPKTTMVDDKFVSKNGTPSRRRKKKHKSLSYRRLI